jgi:hypothetical protein
MHGIDRIRLFRALLLVAGAFILLVHAAGAQGLNPSSVVDTYERAWARQDVDGALAMFADDAVVTLQDARTRTLASRRQIREFLETTHVGTVPMQTSPRQIDGGGMMWSERTDGQILTATDVTVQATVQNGKIESLVYRPGRLVRGSGQPAASSTPEVAGAALAALLLLGVGLLSLATVRQTVRAGSNLRGRLMTDLRHWRTHQAA